MSNLGFFDLLGVTTIAEAAALWPIEQLTLDPADVGQLVAELEGALSFQNLKPSASGDDIGLTADVVVGAAIPSLPVVFASLPKFEFRLIPSSSARVYIRQGPTGVEWIVEAVAVQIAVPDGLLVPIDPGSGDVVYASFDAGAADTYDVTLNATAPSVIRAHVKLRCSEERDFVLQFATPISIGPCRFSGIPCAAVHDLGLILTADPSPAIDRRTEALEWIRHELDSPPGGGFITVRTIDLFDPRSRLFDATAKSNEDRPSAQFVEPVLEDLVLLASAEAPVPFPVHFTAGVRRSLGIDDNPNGIYNLGDKPVVVAVYEGSGANRDDGLYVIVRQALIRSFANGTSLDDPQTAFLDMAISDDPLALGMNATVEITDEWTLEAGIHLEPPVTAPFTLFGAHVKAGGVRAGASFQRLFDDDPETEYWKSLVLVADLVIVLGSEGSAPDPDADPPVKLDSRTGTPTTIVVNDIGYKFGEPAIGNFWQADKAELKAFGTIRLSIDEFGFVTEPDGSRYFSFSGSWPVFGVPTSQPAPGEEKKAALGIQFNRLRWKIRGAGRPLLLDGLGLFIQFGRVSIIGSGMISDRIEGPVRLRETAFAIDLSLSHPSIVGGSLGNTLYSVGGQFIYGRATGGQDFTYVMAGVHVSPIPLSPGVSLVNLRGLFAWDMQPRLGSADAASAQPMRLFEWYKANAGGIEIPGTRNIAASGWEPKQNAWAFAVGAGVRLGAEEGIRIEGFFLYFDTPVSRGLLAALEIYAKGKKPIAYAVVEVEGDRWSVLAGLAIGVQNVTGRELPFFNDAVGLTGTVYATNQPATFAIGRLDDVSSWLALRVKGDLWVFKVQLFVGACLEIVDVPDGTRVIAFRAEVSGGTKRCAIGSIDFSLAMQLQLGVWRSESRVAGFAQWLEGSIRINVLYVFRFGASFKIEWVFLGPDPAYRRIACEIKIRTPWWMPDKTFRWNRTISQPSLGEMATASSPLLAAMAHPLASGDPIAIPVSTLSAEPDRTFSIAELMGIGAPSVPGVPAAVPIDSRVALHFKATVDDRIIWGQNTPPNASRQTSGDVDTTYQLVELGIRRRPLYGPGSSTWTTLLDPADSRTDNLLNAPPPIGGASSPLAMRWDADFQREQTLDPRHLLLNSELPYLHLLANLIGDENIVRTMPGWPCCPTYGKGVRNHVLDFEGLPAGARAPTTQFFSDSRSTLRWLVTPPVVFAPEPAPGPQIARPLMAGLTEGAFAAITFDTSAHSVDFTLHWVPMHLRRSVVISAFRGLKLIDEITLELSSDSPAFIALSDPDGITHVVLRITGRALPASAGISGAVDVISVSYEALSEVLDAVLHDTRCASFDPVTAGNGSRFAWLPNHEYEVRIATRIAVSHTSAGTLAAEVPQIALFRTRALPGFNAGPRIGAELEPYVESVYPAAGATLYRREPALLAFNERFDILQGLDRPGNPADPPERRQRLDLELACDLVVGNRRPIRVSVPSPDWIVAHRGTLPPPGAGDPKVRGTVKHVREAVTVDQQWLRFEVAAASQPGCGVHSPKPRRTRVLSHEPFDPALPDAPVQRWPARTQLRVNLRPAGGPFVDRAGFADADRTALTISGSDWRVVDGELAAPQGGAIQTAAFGDGDWVHLQAEAGITAVETRAGLALSVNGSDALVCWIDVADAQLKISSLRSGVETDLKSTPLIDAAPYLLQVTAFDDEIRARVGSSEIAVPRNDFREGRMAMAAQGSASFASLRVDGLDAYRFEFVTSRYDDFAGHISSSAGEVGRLQLLAAPMHTPAELRGANATFAEWVSALAIPLRAEPRRLEISWHDSGFFLVESPEPLGADVTIRLFANSSEITTVTLVDETASRMLVVCDAPVAGDIRLEFRLDRTRYRAVFADSQSSLQQMASVTFRLA